MTDKFALRRQLLAERAKLSPDVRAQWDRAICAQILTWWQADPLPTLGIFWPIRHEPDLRPLYDELACLGVQLALPVVVNKEAPLEFFPWRPGEALVKDAMGVPVPSHTKNALQPHGLLIPCVGFNPDRIRLGYGGGWYDRTLALAPRPLAIGIGYDCALASFDAAPHDIALDRIITESSCF